MNTKQHFLLPRCTGMNCGATDANHSPECRAEHAAAVAGGRFVKDAPTIAPRADADTAGAPKQKGMIGCADCTDEPECAWHQWCIRKQAAKMEPLGAEFQKVLDENRWDLYAAGASERADAEKDAALTDEQIIEIFQDHYTEEPGDAEPGHILPFARAILAANKEKK